MRPLDPACWPEVRRLLGELGERPPSEHEAVLAGLDPAIAAEVRALLAADDQALSERLGAAVGQGAADWLAGQDDEEDDDRDLAGTAVGPWRLEHPLGRGGMAEVWEASRADGEYEHRVAVKLIKRGMDSAEIIARFRRERQILARLEHPAIARLLDGGAAPDGRPFLVLEKVDGEPITTWCERSGADVAMRLRLLVEVCAAVSAAHRQLVVHRDLKPSNIMVDAAGRVRLLDFGIAKLLDDTEAHATHTDVRVLTPAYAAPEQIRGEPVSTATDVYALGVVAFELLAGRLPHRRTARGATELLAALAGESTESPSTAAGRLAASAADAGRADRLRRAARALAGDLDQILLTALRPEPQRRYPSVDAFAADLERFLAGRPVAARRDTLSYRMRRFVGRHRVAVAAFALALAALLAALGLAVMQARRAERQAARAERVRAFLESVFAVSDPLRARGETVTARALLDEGVHRVDAELAAEPDLRAEMLDLLAGLYRKLGELDVARATAERALALRVALDGRESAAAARSELTLGWILTTQGQFEAARPRLEHAIAVFERIEGRASLAAAEAREPLMELAFASEGPAATLPIVEERLAVYRLAFTGPDERTGRALSDLGVVLGELERFPEAEAAYRESLALLEATVPADDPRLAYPHNNLAALWLATGRPEAALAAAERAVAIRTRALGAAHPETCQSRGQRTQALLALGRLEEAEQNARALLADIETKDRFGTTLARATLGQVQLARQRPGEALATFEIVLAERRALLPAAHPMLHQARFDRARALAAQGRAAEARADLDALLPAIEGRPESASLTARVRELRAQVAD